MACTGGSEDVTPDRLKPVLRLNPSDCRSPGESLPLRCAAPVISLRLLALRATR